MRRMHYQTPGPNTRRVAGNFLRALIAAVPYKVHTVLTNNGTHFTEPSGKTWTPDEIKDMLARKQLFRAHAFELACAQNDVAHRLIFRAHALDRKSVV